MSRALTPPAVTPPEVLEALQRYVATVGNSETARRAGVSSPFLSKVRAGQQVISPKLAELVGYRRVITWELVPAKVAS